MMGEVKSSKLQSIVDAISAGYVLTIKEACGIMHYAPLHVRKLCRDSKIDARKVEGRWLIKEESARQYKGKKGSKALIEENERLKLQIKDLLSQLEKVKAK